MATKDDRSNLLSKVALFVRNPTKDWAELDNLDSVAPSGYDRSALKAAIERKRQNDFIRRREFDQLRKLRKSAAVGEVAAVRPSSFQTSSIMTDPDGRAQTLEKIDEIEAQMSRQWWKGQAASGEPGEDGLASDGSSLQVASTQTPSTGFPSTEPVPDFTPESDFVPTLSNEEAGAQNLPQPLGFEPAQVLVAQRDAPPNIAEALETDPELEEAAIRFANGDDAGAQSVLVHALRADSSPQEQPMAVFWWGALLDGMRASGDRTGFDCAVEEFAPRFPTVRSQWGDEVASGAVLAGVGAATTQPLWISPPRLTLADMDGLRQRMGASAPPWHLDWSALQAVDAPAIPWLASLFSSLCSQPVVVRLDGSAALLAVLQGLCDGAARNHALWVLRLDALRVFQEVVAYESAALDYCVAFNVAPPPWMDAACTLLTEASIKRERAWATQAPLPSAAAVVFDAVLRGHLSGDIASTLVLEEAPARADSGLNIDCSELLRVDFAAAGSLLNWAAQQQAGGRHVRLHGVHRLVAAFFIVIGINEHAQILLRPQ